MPASGGAVPEGAVAWGYEANGEALFVCRAYLNGGLHPGKVRGEFGAANIPCGGLPRGGICADKISKIYAFFADWAAKKWPLRGSLRRRTG